MDAGVARVQGDGAAKARFGLGQFAVLHVNQAAHGVRIGQRGVDAHDLAQLLDGHVDAPGLEIAGRQLHAQAGAPARVVVGLHHEVARGGGGTAHQARQHGGAQRQRQQQGRRGAARS